MDEAEFADIPLRTNPAREDAERAVFIHEVGHSLGLVNRDIPMVRHHEHPDCPHHSSNERFVMWPGIDSWGGGVAVLIAEEGGAPYRFDVDDLADMAAYGASLHGG